MRCFDAATILVAAGTGGKGCVAFRREKFVPKGGPSGGNGGDGGSVYLQADASLNSLLSFRRGVHFRAGAGAPGQGSAMHGCAGRDVVVPVPPGTLVWRREDEEARQSVDTLPPSARPPSPPMAEVLEPGQRVLVARGGRGGRGNLAFKTARATAPTLAERGEPGEEAWLRLELRLVADAGLVGLPNAGKSTLLSVLSAARPRVADYPFTTLVPNLGVAEFDGRTTVLADVPGLIDGAHAGRGLGQSFLRHCARCSALIHVVDVSMADPMHDYAAVRRELELYDRTLASKPHVVALNKVDVPEAAAQVEETRMRLLEAGVEADCIVPVSAVTGQGVRMLARRVRRLVDAMHEAGRSEVESRDATNLEADPALTDPPPSQWATKKATASSPPTPPKPAAQRARLSDFIITSGLRGRRTWRVRGAALERLARTTDWAYFEAATRFENALRAAGINDALVRAGVKEGDTVVIGDAEFEWTPPDAEARRGVSYGAWLATRRDAGVAPRGAAKWPHPSR